MDSTFEYRTRSYRASVMLLVVSTLLTMVGYGTSHWVDMGDSHYGLWLDCPQTSGCVHHHDDTPVGRCHLLVLLLLPLLLMVTIMTSSTVGIGILRHPVVFSTMTTLTSVGVICWFVVAVVATDDHDNDTDYGGYWGPQISSCVQHHANALVGRCQTLVLSLLVLLH